MYFGAAAVTAATRTCKEERKKNHAHRSGKFYRQNLDLVKWETERIFGTRYKKLFVRADQLKLASFETRRIEEVHRNYIFKSFKSSGSIPRNRFRQPM
jgi:hypothetical protein